MPDTSTTPAQPYTSYGQPPSPPPGCATAMAGADHQWYRAGYAPDPNWTGSGNPRVDVPFWISQQFGGTVYAPGRGIPNGNFVPTYCHQGGSCATMGNNIAQGFYCTSNGIAADGIGCSANPSPPSQTTGTYFFRSDRLTLPCAAPDGTVNADVGCRDASVATYTNAEWTKGNEKSATQWDAPGKKGSSGPSRVELVEILNMRFYCQKTATGFCDGPPKAIVGSAGNSDVWGLFLSIAESQCPPGQTCGGGLSWTGNVFGLGG
jgi:hypothetical protein